MSNMVTRCPQCHTSFRVTEEHLKLANGAVRCGSCLLVFQARQHWVDAPSTAASAPPPSNKFRLDQSALENMAHTHAPHSAAHDDGLLGDNGRPSKAFDLSAAVKGSPSSDVEQKKIADIGDDEKISDDTFLDDDEPVIAPKKSAASDISFGDPDDDYGSVFDDVSEDTTTDTTTAIAQDQAFDFNDIDALLDDNAVQHHSDDGVADESWAKDILEEETREEKPAEVDLSSVEDVRDILQDFANPVEDTASSDLGFGRRDPFAASELGSTQRGGHRAEMIAHIDPLPVDLLSTRAGRLKKDWKSLALLVSAAVLLTALLLAQYTFFNFDRLARTSTSRPMMQTLCQVVHCKLPVVENWRYIKIQNLVVRKHAQIPNALVIDAMLMNVTDQALPFPELDLYFSDLTKTPVASRRFKPEEYLSGELSGQTMMPAGRPVHIALEIVNPGDKAVNWSMLVAGNVE
ncbi:MAG TPA: DUF3426 domain-containing protein [Pseudomonadales bacterium]|nr:DUF3426 domain-containing protein [Pseudomonadales bacterium]